MESQIMDTGREDTTVAMDTEDQGLSRRLMLGALLTSGAMLGTRSAAACVVTPTAFKNVKTDFGATGDGCTDDTVALQAAVNSGESLYFPPGEYLISATIVLPNRHNLVYFGSGKGRTRIKQTAAADAFSHSHMYFIISWRDMAIVGGAESRHGISIAGTTYNCDFTEMSFYMGGSGVYSQSPRKPVFSTLFNRCDFNSHNAHGLDIQGGNTCVLLQCLAGSTPSTHYGYRIHSQALMLGCNGISSVPGNPAGGWGCFGASIATGDEANVKFQLTCINCNIESAGTEGIYLKNDGSANIINSTFLAGTSGTYDSHLRVEACNNLIELVNCSFATQGAILSAGRTHPISTPNQARIKVVACNVTEFQTYFGTTKLASEAVVAGENFALATEFNSIKTSTLAVIGSTKSIANALVLGNTTATNVVNGTVTPPAQIAGFLNAYLNGEAIRIPYYKAS